MPPSPALRTAGTAHGRPPSLPAVDHLLALDAANGETVWSFDPIAQGAPATTVLRSVTFDGDCGVYLMGDSGTDCANSLVMLDCRAFVSRLRL